MFRSRIRPHAALGLVLPVLLIGGAAGAAATTPAAATAAAPASAPAPRPVAAKADEAASYSLGLMFSSQWREGGLDGLLNQDGLIRGIRAGLAGTTLTPDDRQRASEFMKGAYEAWAGRNKVEAADFLARNAREPEVQTTASGLQYRVLTKGDATSPGAGPNDHVTVQYTGKLLDGREFDSSYARGQPAVIRPNVVIAGWKEALGMMSRGAQWRLFVPPELAYGTTPPPAIPPNSLLVFDVEVLGIEAAGSPRLSVPAAPAAH